MLANLLIALGGRAAEQIFFETFVSFSDKYNNEVMFTKTPHLDITTGASNDLKQANSIARRYVSAFGMGKNIALYDGTSNAQPFLGRNLATNGDKLSEYSKQEIDREIEDLVQWAYQRAVEILKANQDDFFFLTNHLKEKRDLYVYDFETLDISFLIICAFWNAFLCCVYFFFVSCFFYHPFVSFFFYFVYLICLLEFHHLLFYHRISL